ncbi:MULTISPECIES: hypothetical protein [unclassified Streptomyces]|uniref:WD40/YVTN/BNR-like repeat-containing protein n=1 Tax=unclassified Streptomyces TaxID=2593676 RepID=UPI00336A0EE9
MRRRTFIASVGAVAAGALPVPAFAKPGRQSKDAYTWKNAVVNCGGFVTGIIFNETEPNLIYARTDVAGCYRWQEDSRTWKPLLDWVGRNKWGYYYVVSMATDAVEPNRVYAAVGAYTIDWDPNNGAILYSDDYGDTWGIAELPFKQGGNMPGRSMGERLAIDPSDNATLYLGTPSGNGLWRSRDHGRTWARVENFPNPGNFVVGATWQPVPGAAAALGDCDGNRTIPKQSAVDNMNGYLYIVSSWDPGPYNGAPASGNGGKIQRLATQTGEWTDITPDYNPKGPIPGFGGVTVDRQNPRTLMASLSASARPPSDPATLRSTPRPRSKARTASSARPTAANAGSASTTTITSGPSPEAPSPVTRTSLAASICQHAA